MYQQPKENVNHSVFLAILVSLSFIFPLLLQFADWLEFSRFAVLTAFVGLLLLVGGFRLRRYRLRRHLKSATLSESQEFSSPRIKRTVSEEDIHASL